MPPDETVFTLASARLNQAKRCLQSAEREFAFDTADAHETAANRSYYCIFHAMRAVLALDGFVSKKHSGIISTFRKDYVKTGVFPVEFSDMIENGFDVRNNSDYHDFYIVSKERVATQIENAKTFLSAVEEYLAPKLQRN